MKIPMSWLNEYINTDDIPIKEFCDKMTMSGSKVENYEAVCKEIKKVVSGKIIAIEAHPDADRLKICRVDVKDSVICIVTGATNIREGMKIPVALHGAVLSGGQKITRGKLRGVVSDGMLCSEEELGININEEKSTGIMELPEDTPLGEDVITLLNLSENVVEFEITSNRPDCLGIIGIAREAAATLRRQLEPKSISFKEGSGDISDYLKVRVEDDELCKRYVARVVTNVRIEPSPLWMQRRLNRAGIRAINNIVDITNYVMLEYGQPMHAFDIKHVDGGEIVVRRANPGERIVTLDGVERELSTDMLVIADAKKASAVGGVMGGEYSGVSEDTKTVIFESACFHGPSVRRTSKALALRTESSSRFEKGLDLNTCVPAIERALELVDMLGSGDVVPGTIDCCKEISEPTILPLEADRINALLGTDIPACEMRRILESLEFKVEDDRVSVPSFRSDVAVMHDLAEEVLRIYGYDCIASTKITGVDTEGRYTAEQAFINKIKTVLSDLGCFEIYTYSFTDPKMFDLLKIDEHSKLRSTVNIINPLGEENAIMRTTLLHSMLEVLSTNYNRRNRGAPLFEIANIYISKGEELPEEIRKISLGVYGGEGFFEMKGILTALFERAGITDVKYTAFSENPAFHPYRTAIIKTKDGAIAGIIGEVSPEVLKNYEIGEKTVVCELDFNTLLKNANTQIKYKKLPRFPETKRDIAITINEDIPAGDIEACIRQQGGNILNEIKLFDVYQGSQIAEGKKSVAYSLSFRATDRTLTDDEVKGIMEDIKNALYKELGAELR